MSNIVYAAIKYFLFIEVHGGQAFSESVLINDEVIKAIEDNIELGPLHLLTL